MGQQLPKYADAFAGEDGVQVLAEMKDGWMIVSVPEDGTAGWRMETAGRIGWMKRKDLEVSW